MRLADLGQEDLRRVSDGARARLLRLQELLEHIQSPTMTPRYSRRERIYEKAKIAFAIRATTKLLNEIRAKTAEASVPESASSAGKL